ncbi:hypothetical protein LOK49_LG01G02464 [Camellia lanceoleosa]|uniref:Uncharacterized protein n=1 Tax=Camellia lanceoleosa TaxID=1840588 RepID=A0ACC0J4V8_9ERIC|nr:hypothetical protein LOK49_LG01G02464 [Camellia lanceoleosa]
MLDIVLDAALPSSSGTAFTDSGVPLWMEEYSEYGVRANLWKEKQEFSVKEVHILMAADNAMVGSSVCQGSSSEQGLGKTTIPKPMGDIETATKASTPTTNVQDYDEAKGHTQVRMSCVEGLVDMASMDSETEAEMVQSHSSNGLGVRGMGETVNPVMHVMDGDFMGCNG